MNDQCQHGVGLGRDQGFVPDNRNPVELARNIGFRFRFDQFGDGGGRPVFAGDVVVRACQGVDPPTDQAREFIDIHRLVTRLVDEAADQVEDIAHAVIEFRDQQFLLALGFRPLGSEFVGDAQDNFEKRHAQAFDEPELYLGPFRALSGDRLLPRLEALARRKPCAVRPQFDRLFRITRPGDGLLQFAPPQDHVIARTA